jgi:hypothetical protein
MFCFFGLIIFQSNGQTNINVNASNNDQIVEAWVEDLYTAGVSYEGDSVSINKEVEILLNKSDLFMFMYPEKYTWEVTLALIEKNQLKKAFWYMINLYRIDNTNKELVVKSMLTYNKFLDMEKVLTNTFYTYCFTDPEIGTITNGKPEINAPHILEEKLMVVQQLVKYIQSYEQKERNKN